MEIKITPTEDFLRRKLAQQAHIPEFIINRPKRSFGIRSNHWAEKMVF